AVAAALPDDVPRAVAPDVLVLERRPRGEVDARGPQRVARGRQRDAVRGRPGAQRGDAADDVHLLAPRGGRGDGERRVALDAARSLAAVARVARRDRPPGDGDGGAAQRVVRAAVVVPGAGAVREGRGDGRGRARGTVREGDLAGDPALARGGHRDPGHGGPGARADAVVDAVRVPALVRRVVDGRPGRVDGPRSAGAAVGQGADVQGERAVRRDRRGE